MRFAPDFLDELRNRVPIADLVSKRVQLKKRGHNYQGLCPFHREKTPSFTVNDDKGFYHCFGCQAHGDVIDFVMRSENLSFPEAVEKMAGLAGMRLPAPNPREAERERQGASLNQALEAAARWFAEQLSGPAGGPARDYLAGRGLDAKTIARFRLGFAPDRRHGLKAALTEAAGKTGERFPEKLLIEAGLLIVPEEGGESYDRFRGRVMFPIADRRGRVIGFGARAMGDAKPKYLNSPETPLFHKGRTLYNLANATPEARQRDEVVVAEGYMDVIALDQGGFPHAVAPLGTALTEDQMGELWRLCDEPLLCFDGDEAGLRAAAAAAHRALPLLKPGRSLRFAMLPPGEDPDSLLRKEGPGAITRVFHDAWPLSRMLWTVETSAGAYDTPERRAKLRQDLEQRAAAIQDPKVREEYRRHFEAKFAEMFPGPMTSGGGFRPMGRGAGFGPGGLGQGGFGQGGFGHGSGRGPGSGWRAPAYTSPTTPAGEGVRGRITADDILERALLAAIINHPALLDEVGEDLGRVEFTVPELDGLRQAVVEASGIQGLDMTVLESHLRDQGFSGELRAVLHAQVYQHSAFARPEAPLDIVRKGWREAFDRSQLPILEAQVREAQEAVARDMTPENQRRFFDLKKRLQELDLKNRE